MLDYSAVTFTRASEAAYVDPREGWAFKGATESDNWKATNQPRIFSDGAILMEGSRTNSVKPSIEIAASGASQWWSASTNVTASTNSGGPDGGTCALIVFPTTDANLQWRHDVLNANFPDSTDATFSSYLMSSASTDTIRLKSKAKDNSNVLTATSVDNAWGRYSHSYNTLSGASNLAQGFQNSSPGAVRSFSAHLAQLEAGLFSSSPIRTTTAAATRGAEVLGGTNILPDEFYLTGFAIDIWPMMNHETITGNSYVISFGGSSQRYLLLAPVGNTVRILYRTSVNAFNGGSYTYNPLDKITIEVRHNVSVTVYINDVLTNVASLPGSGNWSDRIGDSTFFGSTSFFGVMSRPRRI